MYIRPRRWAENLPVPPPQRRDTEEHQIHGIHSSVDFCFSIRTGVGLGILKAEEGKDMRRTLF